jgi:hypothetical protein
MPVAACPLLLPLFVARKTQRQTMAWSSTCVALALRIFCLAK